MEIRNDFQKKEKIISGLFLSVLWLGIVKDGLDKWSVSLRIIERGFLRIFILSATILVALYQYYLRSMRKTNQVKFYTFPI